MGLYGGSYCPKCGVYFPTVEIGEPVYRHSRYVDGGGPGYGQDHDMVPCEGSVQPGVSR